VKINIHYWLCLAQFSSEWFQTKAVEQTETHILCPVYFFFENCAVYAIIWENIVESSRPQITIWSMRIACWIPKATNTHSRIVILIVFPLQQCLHERISLLRFMCIVFLVWLRSVQRIRMHCVGRTEYWWILKLQVHKVTTGLYMVIITWWVDGGVK